MMYKGLTFLAIFVVQLATVFAQSYEFRVLANRGQNQIKTGDNWESLKTGTTIGAEDVLKLSEGAYIGLVHNTGKTVELTESGEFKVSELSKQVSAGGSSVAAKYADFVLSKMSSAGESEGSSRQNMNVTGAVTRAAGNSSDIVLMMPKDVDVLSDEAIIRWNDVEDVDTYKITFQNMFDEVIMEKEVTSENFKLDFTDAALKDQNFVKVKVKAAGADKESAEYGIKRLAEWEAEPLKKELSSLKQEISEQNALGKVIYASFYEQNNLLLDALTHYEQAIEMSPEIDDFKMAYQDFLMRNGLGRK